MSIFNKIKSLFENKQSINDTLILISEEVDDYNDSTIVVNNNLLPCAPNDASETAVSNNLLPYIPPPWKSHEIDLSSDEEINYSKYHKMILDHAGVKSIIADEEALLKKDDRKVDDTTKLKWLESEGELRDLFQKKI